MRKLLRWTRKIAARIGPDGALVVGQSGLVRGPDLAEPGARDLEDFREPEAAPDLHELAPRDDDLAAGRHRPQGQDRRAGVIVDDCCGFGTCQLSQQSGDPRSPAPARAVGEIELQVAVARRDFRNRRDRLRGQRRPAQAGMQQDAGRVDHRTEHGPVRRQDFRRPPRHVRQIGLDRPPFPDPLRNSSSADVPPGARRHAHATAWAHREAHEPALR